MSSNKLDLNRRIKRHLLWLWNFWPPFFGAGIQVKRISEDFTEIDVKLKHRFWNANYVGTAFGGSLFAMTDPFYMVMLYETLGPGFVVWDKAARIDYLKPGQSDLWAYFKLSTEQIESFRSQTILLGKFEPEMKIEIVDVNKNIIAVVHKTLYIRVKNKKLTEKIV
jgi:acyl-coenzyme A thioesterase PaaI-like protein